MIRRALPALRRSAELATRHPRTALGTLAALAAAMFVAGLGLAAATAVDRWAAAHPGSRGAMVVYLGDGVDEPQAAALVRELRKLPGVERAELITAADSAGRLTRALGADAALLDGVELASLPASVEVTLAPGVRDVAALSPTVRALRGAPGVAEVVVEPGADDHSAAPPAAHSAAWAAAAVLATLALVIALAALRARLARTPREAAVLELLGAPTSFAAIPTALAGALHGAAAALIAALALAVLLPDLAGWLGTAALSAPSAAALAALVGLGALIGAAGGCLAGVGRAA